MPLLLAGGPVARAVRARALVLTPALGAMAVGGVHRLEDLAPTLLELLQKPQRKLRTALAQLGLAGRSLLWASRHPAEASRRVLVQHSMYGARKVGLVRGAFWHDGGGD